MSNFGIIILAAGEGKRMKSGLPKVLHEICSKPMIRYVVDAARGMGPKKIIVVVGQNGPQVKSAIDRDVSIAYQKRPLGTGDAVKAASRLIPVHAKHVIVLYGDTPLMTTATIQKLYDFHIERSSSCTVLTTFLDNPTGYGRILRNETGQFIGIIEEKDATYRQKTIKEINTGMYCFNKEDLLKGLEHINSLNQSGEFYLTDVASWLFHKNKKIDACVADNSYEVLGVNTQVQLLEAAQMIRVRILTKYLESGVRIMDMATTFIDETAEIGLGTHIFPFTVIGKNVTIGKDCSIGPFCHLREGAILKDRVSVGNFAEIKNSAVGEGTFMRHVGYLGDTQVGRKVNIGAGTIVANFDGKKKHKTVIKDKAFVGCDSVLIAPVVIGRGAVVGAGSVVTRNHNVADGATVVGVPAREIKKLKR